MEWQIYDPLPRLDRPIGAINETALRLGLGQKIRIPAIKELLPEESERQGREELYCEHARDDKSRVTLNSSDRPLTIATTIPEDLQRYNFCT